jgi:hypothetical protein
MGPAGALRLIEAAGQGAPSAAALFPREAAANQGLFYANGAPRSAQALLERLNLHADANMSAGRRLEYGRDGEAMSPALAQALFTMALLPLLSGSEGEEREQASRAYAAYAQMLNTRSTQ